MIIYASLFYPVEGFFSSKICELNSYMSHGLLMYVVLSFKDFKDYEQRQGTNVFNPRCSTIHT